MIKKLIFSKNLYKMQIGVQKQFEGLNHQAKQNINIDKALKDIRYGPNTSTDEDLTNLSLHIQRKMQQLSKEPIEGKLADYIPELQNADPNALACSVCTVDGKQFSVGMDKLKFSFQSCVKPFTYLIASHLNKREKVHQHVGREPSGQAFNSFQLNEKNIPYNPMINAGAITTASLIQPQMEEQERFNYLYDFLKQIIRRDEDQEELYEQSLTSHSQYMQMKYSFNYKTYMSEKQSGSRNTALAHFLNSEKVFGKQLSFEQIQKNLNFYFEGCCLDMNVNSAAALAATIANAGISPINGKRFFEERHTVSATQIMFSCGMYNYSGNWACNVGIPAKSGVSGLILAVIPNLMGIAFYSPPLDENGNSERGIKFYEWLAEEFHFNIFSAILENGENPFSYWRERSRQPLDNIEIQPKPSL